MNGIATSLLSRPTSSGCRRFLVVRRAPDPASPTVPAPGRGYHHTVPAYHLLEKQRDDVGFCDHRKRCDTSTARQILLERILVNRYHGDNWLSSFKR